VGKFFWFNAGWGREANTGTNLTGKLYKRGSQEKTLLRWLEVFLLRSPLD